ncbi:MAG: hypothetical protein A2428_11635 [Bdellovibrionales bacterium RIFOXYC1_FULL_54_43]|nr:MAG: hypothetical protein A2428_11635 [Bdellovibrionales bacterium RIFOXYC1_FULL_54_43]OFZ84815.1 MAG: hypothetical protein A2603_02820 [Bdellovibrionales bacterium RIFOXYD1_FULL_55_31]
MAKEQQPGKAAAPAPSAGAPAPVHKQSEPTRKTKEYTPLPGGCNSWGCKAQAHRFNFCDEHYDQFKFGLIKKTGEPVPDFEKKLEHYNAWKAKHSAHRVA